MGPRPGPALSNSSAGVGYPRTLLHTRVRVRARQKSWGFAVERLHAAGIPVPDVLVTAEHVENGKPDPAGYLRAAALLGVDPACTFVLEDAPVGVDAGIAAGMTVIAALTTNDGSGLTKAHRRIADLRALLPLRDRLVEAARPGAQLLRRDTPSLVRGFASMSGPPASPTTSTAPT